MNAFARLARALRLRNQERAVGNFTRGFLKRVSANASPARMAARAERTAQKETS